MRSWLWKGMLAAAITLPALSGATRAQDISGQSGDVHIIKNCVPYTGAAGSYCMFTQSNVPEIPAGARVYYDQAAEIAGSFILPLTMFDSNVILIVGPADWAVGRCTVNFTSGAGICTFADGVGALTGFSARVVVSRTNDPSGKIYEWDGSYHFSPPAGQQ